MRLVEIPLDDARWPAFLESVARNATIFHSPAWVRTLCRVLRVPRVRDSASLDEHGKDPRRSCR